MKTLQQVLSKNEDLDLRKVFPKAKAAVVGILLQKLVLIIPDNCK